MLDTLPFFSLNKIMNVKYQGNKGCCRYSFNLMLRYSFFVLEIEILSVAALKNGTSAVLVLILDVFSQKYTVSCYF